MFARRLHAAQPIAPLVFSDDLVLARRPGHTVLYAVADGMPALLGDFTDVRDAWQAVDTLDGVAAAPALRLAA